MVQLALDRIEDSLTPSQRRAVLGDVGSGTIEAIRGARRTEWVDASLQAELNQAAFRHCGPEGYDQLWRSITMSSTKDSLFAALAGGMLRILGVSPRRLVNVIPRAANHVARNTGVYEIVDTHDPRSAMMVFRGIHPELRRDETWARASRGSLLAVTDLLKLPGSVSMDFSDLSDGVARYTLTWELPEGTPAHDDDDD